METNEYAMRAINLEEFELKTGNYQQNAEKTLFQIIKVKYYLIKECLKEKTTKKFFLFMLLQGFLMPTFSEFSYIFALDV